MARKRGAAKLMSGDGDRRQFFRATLGRVVEEVAERTERRVVPQRYFRPPGALAEVAFIAACTRCGDCLDVCPAHAIFNAPPGAGLAAGTPVIEPTAQPCVACSEMKCAVVCPTDALIPPDNLWEGYRMAELELEPEKCIAFKKIECGVCARACPLGEKALGLDGEGRPVIKWEGCVGCGVCVRACTSTPVSLILHML
jgi:ferredoxin-type protein NapG